MAIRVVRPEQQRLIALLAALCKQANFSICYCEDPSHCHRTVLAELLADAGAMPAQAY